MSVDYYSCNNCGETFSDCGYYVSCETCGTHWCSDECAKEDGYVDEHCGKYSILDNRDIMEYYRNTHCNYDDCCDCEYYNAASCKYCRNEDYDDLTLLNKALELLNMSREELVAVVNKTKEEMMQGG